MALKELQENVEIIQTLSTYPNQEECLSAEALKAKFDEGVRIIKTYLNEKVVPAYNQLLQAVGDNKIEADDEIAAIGEQLNNLNVLLDGVINDKSTSVDSTWSSQKIIQVINVAMANIKENINQKINDNIDPTLSVSGKAADAKAVGDALKKYVPKGESENESATVIGSGNAFGDCSFASGKDTIAGCKGYYIAAIDPGNNHIYLHTGGDAVVPTWDNPSSFYDEAFESGYVVLGMDVPYGNEFSVSADGYYHWPFAGNITKISGNRITYSSDTLNTSERWLSNVDGGADPFTFYIPVQSNVGLTSIGLGAFAEGWNTHAAGNHSHAEGYYSIAAGRYGHAEGDTTRAGFAAHAEGGETTAQGLCSHSEGYKTTASGQYSHAEGESSIASGLKAHAEGHVTTASGQYSHAQNAKTIASGKGSHAEGSYTEATGEYQHVQGKYNVKDTEGKYAHIVGNGTSDKKRSNAHTLDWNGNAWFSGDVTVGAVNDKLATQTYVDGRYITAGRKSGSFLGNRATAEGGNTTASSVYSHAEGYETTASGAYSHAEGISTTASGNSSHSEGCKTQAVGIYAHAEGNGSRAEGRYSHAESCGSIASGNESHAEGSNSKATGVSSHAEGSHSFASGTSSHAEGNSSQAKGEYSHAEGNNSLASGNGSHAEGYSTQASGHRAHAEGINTTASGINSHAEGQSTVASGWASHAEGRECKATSDMAHAEGSYTVASSKYSHSSGFHTNASSYACTVMGQYNKHVTTSPSVYNAGADAFVIGNGSSDTARTNAFRVSFKGQVFGAGAYTTGGADYAEYFEWSDGNPNSEDRIGHFVALDNGGYIKLANGDDEILGVISGFASVIGDAYEDTWSGMYVRDIYGRPLFEEVPVEYEDEDEEGNVVIKTRIETHFKLNPAFDPELEYVPRSERPEWDAVGLMGKLVVVDDGTCVVGGKCTCGADGIAVAADAGYHVLKRLDATHIQILLK